MPLAPARLPRLGDHHVAPRGLGGARLLRGLDLPAADRAAVVDDARRAPDPGRRGRSRRTARARAASSSEPRSIIGTMKFTPNAAVRVRERVEHRRERRRRERERRGTSRAPPAAATASGSAGVAETLPIGASWIGSSQRNRSMRPFDHPGAVVSTRPRRRAAAPRAACPRPPAARRRRGPRSPATRSARRRRAPRPPRGGRARRIPQRGAQRLRQRRAVVDRDEPAGLTLADDQRRALGRRRHGRQPAGHRLDQHLAEALAARMRARARPRRRAARAARPACASRSAARASAPSRATVSARMLALPLPRMAADEDQRRRRAGAVRRAANASISSGSRFTAVKRPT